MPRCFNTPIVLLLILSAVGLYSPAIHCIDDSPSATIHFVLPADPEVPFAEIQSTSAWQESKDGWIAEHYSSLDFWFGETPKVTWLKLDLSQLPAPTYGAYTIELASSGLSRSSLHYLKKGTWHTLHSDVLLRAAVNEKPARALVRSRFITFLIEDEWRENTIYIRAEAPTKLHLQVNVQQYDQLVNNNLTVDAFFYFCYGILFVMAIYNLIIGRYIRDKIYYFYAAAIITTLLYQFFAHGHGRLFGYFDWDKVNHALNFLAMSSAWTALIFLYFFANFKRFTPKLSKVFKSSLYVFGMAAFVTLFLPTNAALNVTLLLAGPTPLFALSAALWCWYKGSKAAGVFVIAWSFYILGGSLWAMYWLGLFTLSNVVELPLVAGAALESILLSLALGYRIQLLKLEGYQLKQSEEYYKTISNLDSLTQLANRRAFEQHIKTIQSKGTSFGLILLDIDHFKTFNDTYGHPAGDKVLQTLGGILKGQLRENDIACRMGGEEFAVVIENADIFVTKAIAERIREQFSQQAFEQKGNTVYCTTSIGVSVVPPEESTEDMLERTDKALYKAKEMGRNQCQLAA